MRLRPGQLFFLWLLVFLLVWPGKAWGQPEVTADAAALMDAGTGVLFYAKNGTQRREPASLTKIMTCILAMELADPGEVVTVSRRAAGVWVGSDIDLRTGERIKLGELLKAALICSANDATVAIAEGVAGDHDTFVRWMNAKAVLLGMRKTNFVNTSGYSHPSHYSTAADLAVLTRYALRNPYFASLVRTREATVYWAQPPRKLRVKNTNRLLRGGSFPGLTGVKTGTTGKAGQCLIASASLEGRDLIAVVLHSDGRYWDAKRLLAWGMEALEKLPVCHRGEYYTRLRVHGGRLPDVPLVADRAVTVPLPREQKELLQKEVRLFPAPAAPVEVGQRLGEIIFRWQGQELGRVALVAGRKIKERPWYWFWRRTPF